MSQQDHLYRFLFEQFPVRGEFVRLQDSWQEVLNRHEYPPVVRDLLGQAMAATALLGATIKFLGSLIFQIQGDGPISLLVVQVDTDRQIRAMAEYDEDVEDGSLKELFGNGRLVITIEMEGAKERYQGIVELGDGGLEEAIQGYFQRSEQLQTRLWLTADESQATGLLLQEMPVEDESEQVDDAWDRFVILAETLTDEEMKTLSVREILHRLFHEEDIRLFEPQAIRFHCSCTRGRIEDTLRQLGYDEISDILREQGMVSVDCSFCNKHYEFDPIDVEQIFTEGISPELPKTRH